MAIQHITKNIGHSSTKWSYVSIIFELNKMKIRIVYNRWK